jgi:hypothetical protein
MVLEGQAKVDYMREYMRRRRSNKIDSKPVLGLTESSEKEVKGLTNGSNKGLTVDLDAEGNWIPEYE